MSVSIGARRAYKRRNGQRVVGKITNVEQGQTGEWFTLTWKDGKKTLTTRCRASQLERP